MSTQGNCTLSDGHSWTGAICSVYIDFSFWTLFFSYLTVFSLAADLFVVLVWVDGNGFDLLSLLICPHFEKFKSTRFILINPQLPGTVFVVFVCLVQS